LPVAGLRRDERPQFGLLRFQAERLVVLVGGAAQVDRDAAAGVLDDLPDAVGVGVRFAMAITSRSFLVGCRPSLHP
jgi:hypothetical protein